MDVGENSDIEGALRQLVLDVDAVDCEFGQQAVQTEAPPVELASLRE
jgi:hypothetical protein